MERFEDARGAASHAVNILADSLEYHLWGQFPRIVEALALGEDYDQAEHACARAEAVGRLVESPMGLAFASYGRGFVALRRGDAEKAVQFLEMASPIDAMVPLKVCRLRALASALVRRGAQGDAPRARDVLQEALAICEQMDDRRKAEQVRAELTHLLG